MREWYSIAELEAARAPGMPTSLRRIFDRAQREGWQSRPRTGLGGGREYHLSSLPEAARLALVKRELAAEAQAKIDAARAALSSEELAAQAEAERRELHARKEAAMAEFECQPDWKKARARARRMVLQARECFIAGSELKAADATAQFCEQFNAGAIVLGDEVRAHIQRLTFSTLYRWQAAERERGLMGLCDAFGNRRGDSRIARNPELEQTIVGLMVAKPTIRALQVLEYLRAEKPDFAQLVSERSLQRWMRDWKRANASAWLHHTNPDAWKSKNKVAFGDASESIVRLNQLWEFDSTPADVMLQDGRHSVLGVIDVYSRRLKLLVSKTSKAAMVATLLRRSILNWGVPEIARTDNGKEYVSSHFAGVLRDLEVQQLLCVPFASEQKPFIERSFHTFSHGIVELLPGFIGHNVAERQAIRSRKSFAQRLMTRGEVVEVGLTSQDLQKVCDQWCEAVYHHDAHEGLGGRTPFEVVSAWTAPVRRIDDERALDVLLAEAPQGSGRNVQKKGVHVDGAWFAAAGLAAHIGERVRVKVDPDDLGRIWVYSGDGAQFICVALCHERLNISPAEMAAKGRALQQEAEREKAQKLRAAKKTVSRGDIARKILESREREAAQLIQLRQPEAELHTTPQLEAAAAAGRALEPKAAEPIPAEVLERGAAVILQLESAREAKAQAEQAERAAIERFSRLARTPAAELTETERAWVQEMAQRDPVIRTWMQFEAPELLPLVRGAAGFNGR